MEIITNDPNLNCKFIKS